MRILLADDDVDDRFLFENAMREIDTNCHLITAQDGEECINVLYAAKPAPDMIVLDVNMPKKNGLSCLKDIRSKPRYDHIPIIMFSTGTSNKEVIFAYNNKANLFIRKPNSYAGLKDIVRYCLQVNFMMLSEMNINDFLVLDSRQLLPYLLKN